MPEPVGELRPVECPISDLWVSTKCGESDTTSGCGSNPTVGSAFDKLEPLGVTMCFGETTEITGGENIVADRCATPEVREKFMKMFNRYQEVVGHPNVTFWACKPCVDVRGLAAAALDKRVKLGGMNEFHAASRQPDTRVITF